MRFFAAAALAAVMLAACTPGGAPGAKGDAAATPAGPTDPTGFKHHKGAELFGYYTATPAPRVGTWELSNFHIAEESEFAKWEANQRMETYGPIMLEFDNTASPMQTNELGGQFHSESERVLPSAYSIAEDGTIDFVGTSAKLGKVTFHGKLNPALIKTIAEQTASTEAPPAGYDSQATVLTGTLTVGDKRFENLTFTWFGGD